MDNTISSMVDILEHHNISSLSDLDEKYLKLIYDNYVKECKLEEVKDCKEMDPAKDIYPCLNYPCKKFHKTDVPLWSAIEFLQVGRVQEIMDKMTEEEIIKKYPNLLMQIIKSMRGSSRETMSKLHVLRLSDFNSNVSNLLRFGDPHTVPVYRDLASDLLKYICMKCPLYITNEIITYLSTFGANKLTEILASYYPEKEEDDAKDRCFICFLAIDDYLIDCPCVCKMKIHMKCLLKTISKFGDVCRTCKKPYKSHRSDHFDSKIFFPSANIYFDERKNTYQMIDKKDKPLSLYYATTYCCVNRVKEIFDEMDDKEFKDYMQSDAYPTFKVVPDVFTSAGTKVEIQSKKYGVYCHSFHSNPFEKDEEIMKLYKEKGESIR